MLSRVVLAIVVGVIVALACVLIGGLLATLDVDFAVTVGDWLKRYASVLGLLSALWHFFSGTGWPRTP